MTQFLSSKGSIERVINNSEIVNESKTEDPLTYY